MANIIKHKRSSTAGAIPTASQLEQGQIAVNLTDKKLYTKDASNVVVSLNNVDDGSITTAKLADGAVTGAKLASSAVTTVKIADGAVTSAKIDSTGFTDSTKTALNATGSAPIFACRAWVNFNGSGSIRGQGNVASVSREGVGRYKVNFTTAMPDANYAVMFSDQGGSSSYSNTRNNQCVRETNASYVRVQIVDDIGNSNDPDYLGVVVFR